MKIWNFILTIIVISFILSLLVGEESGNVAVIRINGPIVINDDGLFSSQTTSDEIVPLIEKADKDNGIKAIILEINSPGGSPVASDEIGEAIKKTKKETVAVIRELGASGAYWIASSTDHIIANRMSITGSIGVTSSYLSFEGFLEDHNVSYNELAIGKYKEMGNPFKGMSKEEREKWKSKLNMIYDYFVETVAKNRNMSIKRVYELADGEFYLGIEAKKNGLIDELGNMEDAKKYLNKKIGKVDLVYYNKGKKTIGDLFGSVISRRMSLRPERILQW